MRILIAAILSLFLFLLCNNPQKGGMDKQNYTKMEKKRKSKIQKWDEVGGAAEVEIDEATADASEEAGAGPAISKNPMRGIEDMVEQNDNNFDGVINNLPEPKPVAQVDSEDVIEEVQKKKSVLEKIRENAPDPEKVKPMSLCPYRELC